MTNTWLDIITDPHHLFADFIMNTAYELLLIVIVYRVMYKKLYKTIVDKSSHKKDNQNLR